MSRARDTAGIIQYNQISFDSNNAVGIGSSIPDTKLDVNGGVRVTGIVTASSFVGDVTGTITGDATGLTGTPNIDCGTGSFTGDVDIADKIVHTGDTNTAIRFPAADTFTVETGGSEALRVDSSQRLLVGTTSSILIDGVVNSKAQIEHSDYDAALTIKRSQNSSGGPTSFFVKSRGPVGGANTVVQSGDTLGRLRFFGTDGSDPAEGASISAVVDGTPGSNDMPGRIVFNTSADGAASPTERLRITSAGNVSIKNDSGKFTVGAGDDLEIYHDGSDSYIVEGGTGDLNIQANAFNVKSADGSVTAINYDPDSTHVVSLYYNNSVKLATKSDGIDITGELQCDSLDVDGAADITGVVTLHSDLDMQDSDQIKMGTGDDFIINHDGANTYISNYTGQLVFRTVSNEISASFVPNGAVNLYHNNSVRVATTADGADISGTGSLKVPVGTTAQRSGSPTAGDFRYNSTLGQFEGYTTEWGEIGGGGGITTTASAPSANTIVYLDLGAAQYHELALSAGITTISCSNGNVGESHVVVINQPSSGIATVGFDTYFEFPSGAVPSMSEGSSKVDMVSFVVKKAAGAGGTELLASAGLNYQ